MFVKVGVFVNDLFISLNLMNIKFSLAKLNMW